MNYEQALNNAIMKTKMNMEHIGNDLREYTACTNGKYVRGNKDQFLTLDHIFNWTQSFFTGMAYWAYQITKDAEFLRWNYGFYRQYFDKVFETPFETMHDLGFLYTPYAVAMYKLTGDENMKKIGVKAADELAKRFDPNGRYIRAWGRLDDQIPAYVDDTLKQDHFFAKSRGLAIIDCMMNLPLLYWSWRETHNPFYMKIANAHADTTLKYFVREDDSVCHAYYFDETGKPVGPANYCGYDINSHWARGTSWEIYGFAIAFEYTKKQEYLDTAIRLCKRFISLCDNNGIPVWDFRLPKSTPALWCGKGNDKTVWDAADYENTKYNKDTSAAAVAVCGMMEILRHRQDEEIKKAVDTTLSSLIDKYMNTSMETPGLLSCQNGNMTYTIYGDYYLMEALVMKQYNFERLW